MGIPAVAHCRPQRRRAPAAELTCIRSGRRPCRRSLPRHQGARPDSLLSAPRPCSPAPMRLPSSCRPSAAMSRTLHRSATAWPTQFLCRRFWKSPDMEDVAMDTGTVDIDRRELEERSRRYYRAVALHPFGSYHLICPPRTGGRLAIADIVTAEPLGYEFIPDSARSATAKYGM